MNESDQKPMDNETLLARFRRWLEEAHAEAEALGAPAAERRGFETMPEAKAEPRDVGFFQLIEEFTALRHELKLQTRSSRNLQEQGEALLGALQQAIDQFRAVAPKEAEAARAAAQPLALALADLDEALDRGRLGLEKGIRRLAEESGKDLHPALDAAFARLSWLRRLLLKSYHEEIREIVRRHDEAGRELAGTLLEGYGLIQARLRRALSAEQIEAIECLDQPVDPELMTVVAIAEDSGRPPGVVVAEIRRGYTWQGRLLRYAEVRASRGPSA